MSSQNKNERSVDHDAWRSGLSAGFNSIVRGETVQRAMAKTFAAEQKCRDGKFAGKNNVKA
jgi:hypothetical protein